MTSAQKGVSFALITYLLWGIVFPIYFKYLGHVPASEVLLHRIFWAMPATGLLLIVLRRTKDVMPSLRQPKQVWLITLAGFTIALNWGVYVYAIGSDQALEVSRGYFMSPLVTVALGFFVLRESINRLQAAAIALAAIAVLIQIVSAGQIPWIALFLALSFGFYSLQKKKITIGPVQGFFIETLILFPFALMAFGWLEMQGQSSFSNFDFTTTLLFFAGPLTTLALILYAAGAQRISLTTNGLMQYIAPSLIFLIAVFLFKEPMDVTKFVSFLLIWIGLALYTYATLTNTSKS